MKNTVIKRLIDNNGREQVVRVRKNRGFLAEARLPKQRYKLVQANWLKSAKPQDDLVFDILDHG